MVLYDNDLPTQSSSLQDSSIAAPATFPAVAMVVIVALKAHSIPGGGVVHKSVAAVSLVVVQTMGGFRL